MRVTGDVKKLLPRKGWRNKTGAYGNEPPVFFRLREIASICHTLEFSGVQRVLQKLAQVLL